MLTRKRYCSAAWRDDVQYRGAIYPVDKMRLCTACDCFMPPYYVGTTGTCFECSMEGPRKQEIDAAPDRKRRTLERLVADVGRETVDRIMLKLTDRQREAARLVWIRGFRAIDAARRMKVKKSTLSEFLKRGRETFAAAGLPPPRGPNERINGYFDESMESECPAPGNNETS